MAAKLCAVCGSDLPPLVRIDCRYCGVRCRVRAHRLRDDAANQRREKRRGARADKRMRGLLNSAERKLALAQQDNAALRAKLTTAERKIPPSLDARKSLSSHPSTAPAGGEVTVLRRKLAEARAQIATLERRMVTAAPAPLAPIAALRNEINQLRQQNTVLRGQNDYFRDLVNEGTQDYHDLRNERDSFKTALSDTERERERLRSTASQLARQAEQVPTLTAEVERSRRTIGELEQEAATLRKERDAANAYASASTMNWAEQTRKQLKEREAVIQATSDAALERRIERSQNAGWQPRVDPLVCEVKAEFEAADRLAQWQKERRRPVTARRLESRDDGYLLALRAAMVLREEYQQNSSAGRRGIARWKRFGYELDSESERILVEETRKRIEHLKQPIQQRATSGG